MSFFTPRFIILLTFFMCGAVFGCFTGSYVPDFSITDGMLNESLNIYILSIINALKYSVFSLLLSKFFGFLIPFVCLLRGFFLSFTITAIYQNIENFFESEIIIKSFAENVVALPIFLIISSISLDFYINRLKFNNRKAKIKSRLENHTVFIIFLLILNVGWNIIINMVF